MLGRNKNPENEIHSWKNVTHSQNSLFSNWISANYAISEHQWITGMEIIYKVILEYLLYVKNTQYTSRIRSLHKQYREREEKIYIEQRKQNSCALCMRSSDWEDRMRRKINKSCVNWKSLRMIRRYTYWQNGCVNEHYFTFRWYLNISTKLNFVDFTWRNFSLISFEFILKKIKIK
jgi:hypothetical protein